MIKLLSSKRIIECEFYSSDTNELLVAYIDLVDIFDVYEASAKDIDKNGLCYHVETATGVWLVKGSIREMVSFWNEYKRTSTKLILN